MTACAAEIVGELELRGAVCRARGGRLEIARARAIDDYLLRAAHAAEAPIVEFLRERDRRRAAEKARHERRQQEARRHAELRFVDE